MAPSPLPGGSDPVDWISPPADWSPAVTAGLSTRRGGVSRGAAATLNLGTRPSDPPALRRRNLARLAAATGLPLDRAARARLEHGVALRVVTRERARPHADGLLTTRTGLPLSLTVADCVPLFLALPHRAIALTEGNMSTSIGTILPAVAIGGFAAAGLGWRTAFVVPAVLWLFVWLAGRSEPFPAAAREQRRHSREPMPGRYWWYWAALIPGTSVEWALAAWGAGYLVDVGGTTESAASLLMTAFFASMVGGRLVVSRIARRADPSTVLGGAVAVGLAGFLIVWASTRPGAIVTGLFVSGAGIAGIFPMLLSLAVASAPGRVDLAAARANLAAGIALFAAPQTLGIAADRIGLRPGFGIVAGLFVVTWLLAEAGIRRPDR